MAGLGKMKERRFHKTIGSIVAGILLASAAGARSRKMLQIDAHSNGREVSLRAGETLEISLAENRTTGFRWRLESNAGPACKLLKSSFEASLGATGRGGVHHWQFQAVQAGAGKIELEYRRPWEEDSPPSRTFTLRVRVIEESGPRNSKPSESSRNRPPGSSPLNTRRAS